MGSYHIAERRKTDKASAYTEERSGVCGKEADRHGDKEQQYGRHICSDTCLLGRWTSRTAHVVFKLYSSFASVSMSVSVFERVDVAVAIAELVSVRVSVS